MHIQEEHSRTDHDRPTGLLPLPQPLLGSWKIYSTNLKGTSSETLRLDDTGRKGKEKLPFGGFLFFWEQKEFYFRRLPTEKQTTSFLDFVFGTTASLVIELIRVASIGPTHSLTNPALEWRQMMSHSWWCPMAESLFYFESRVHVRSMCRKSRPSRSWDLLFSVSRSLFCFRSSKYRQILRVNNILYKVKKYL